MLLEIAPEAHGAPVVEARYEPEVAVAYRYEIAVVLLNSVTGQEALFRYESNSDSIGEMFDNVRAAGYRPLWGVHESFVTDRHFSGEF